METGLVIETPTHTQVFMKWFMYNYYLPGGKSVISFAKDLDLTEEELDMVQRLEEGIVGYFRILNWSEKVEVQDLLTEKTYIVRVVDMTKPKTDIIIAQLVKNYDEEYFFFGGVRICDHKDVKMQLRDIGVAF